VTELEKIIQQLKAQNEELKKRPAEQNPKEMIPLKEKIQQLEAQIKEQAKKSPGSGSGNEEQIKFFERIVTELTKIVLGFATGISDINQKTGTENLEKGIENTNSNLQILTEILNNKAFTHKDAKSKCGNFIQEFCALQGKINKGFTYLKDWKYKASLKEEAKVAAHPIAINCTNCNKARNIEYSDGACKYCAACITEYL
jgi:hypothetical protein